MKLRIENQTLRLRLAPEDVAELVRAGRVAGAVAFPPDGARRLVYELEVSADVEAASARFETERIAVTLPAPAARALTETELVGLEERLPLEGGSQLLLIVEKDLKPRRPAAQGEAPSRAGETPR